MPQGIATDILVIGAGLSGLSAAHHLLAAGADFLVVEGADRVGGKATTEEIDGFLFDVTGHWLHLRDPGIRALVFGLLGEDHFHRIERISRIWSHGVHTEYPFQANTWGLPPEIVKECLLGAIEADRRRAARGPDQPEPLDFADWIRFYFGDGIARHFMVPYNAKLWGVPAHEITSLWCQRFVPKPKLEDIVGGAVGCNARGMGYNATFLYPRRGGIQTLADALAAAVGPERIRLNAPVAAVDLAARRARLADGREIAFRRLVNTMALPRFVATATDAPPEVRAAAGRLRATEVAYLNVGVRGELGLPDHWVYVPEESWPMYRVGSFSNAVPEMAPPGHASLYVELSDRDTPPEHLIPRVTEGLVAMGMIRDPAQVRFVHARRIPDAYVIYDFAWQDARAAVHAWLEAAGARSIGRYGDWNYSSMEDALIDGRRTASQLSEME